jgi:hypothetical protein
MIIKFKLLLKLILLALSLPILPLPILPQGAQL